MTRTSWIIRTCRSLDVSNPCIPNGGTLPIFAATCAYICCYLWLCVHAYVYKHTTTTTTTNAIITHSCDLLILFKAVTAPHPKAAPVAMQPTLFRSLYFTVFLRFFASLVNVTSAANPRAAPVIIAGVSNFLFRVFFMSFSTGAVAAIVIGIIAHAPQIVKPVMNLLTCLIKKIQELSQ